MSDQEKRISLFPICKNKVRHAFKSPMIAKPCKNVPPRRGEKRKIELFNDEIKEIVLDTNVNQIEDLNIGNNANCSQDIVSTGSLSLSNPSTPKALKLHSNKSFKIPFRSPLNIKNKVAIYDEYENLTERNRKLSEEIDDLEQQGYNEEQAQIHIKELHDYNDIKDAAQFVMGRLAEMDGLTLKELHQKYNAPTKE